jgi:hypothetical protein
MKYDFKHIQEESIENKIKRIKGGIEDLKKFNEEKIIEYYLDFIEKLTEELKEETKYYFNSKWDKETKQKL